MTNFFLQEDFERESEKEAIYLQEVEDELWLWWQETIKRQKGEIITYDNTEIPEFIREGMES